MLKDSHIDQLRAWLPRTNDDYLIYIYTTPTYRPLVQWELTCIKEMICNSNKCHTCIATSRAVCSDNKSITWSPVHTERLSKITGQRQVKTMTFWGNLCTIFSKSFENCNFKTIFKGFQPDPLKISWSFTCLWPVIFYNLSVWIGQVHTH